MIHVSFTFSELVGTFLDKLKESNELDDFFQSNYSRSASFALGHDERDEYGEADAPFVVITPMNWEGGITSASVVFSFDIEIGIVDSTFNDHEFEGVQDMRGFHKLDEAVNVVMSLLEEHASEYNGLADNINASYNNSEFFPMHIATLNVDVRMDTVMNGRQALGR